MKQINISVVGLSGTEKDKGQIGVGKSCLCNRFIRSTSDNYFIDHISVLSQSDFSGRIVNNDHFLYWGEVRKTTEDGIHYNFSIIEQTEFIDDSTFQPFKVGKMEPYTKRCIATKVYSAEKLVYVCKNQLGLEKEYEQKLLPEGRLSIDGFLVIFDVSLVPNRSIEKQVEFVNTILLGIFKTKKPVVLVTTKNDDANEVYVREAERICQRKEYKNSIQLVETSAHESTNTDAPFLLLAQIIDKTKNRIKIISYLEASKSRKEMLDIRTEAIAQLIRVHITDYHTLWSNGCKILAQYQEWIEFLNLFGYEAGQRIFRRHMKKLRDEHLDRRLKQYLEKFSCALQACLPSLNEIDLEIFDDWDSTKNYLRNHDKFNQYFFDCQTSQWSDLSDVSDVENEFRIPFDVLKTPEAESIFRNHLNALQHEQKQRQWKRQFKSLLEETGYVTPGKSLTEVRVLFMGRECFEALSEIDCQMIYENHQKEITEKAKYHFKELLLERVDLFSHLKVHESPECLSLDDIKSVTDVLQQDLRYKMLDRLDQERKLLLFKHLRFLYNSSREHCLTFPNCIDSFIEKQLAQRKAMMQFNQLRMGCNEINLNIFFLGSDHSVSEIIEDIRLHTGCKGKFMHGNKTYYLNYCILNGDINSLQLVEYESNGLICVYNNQHSFEIMKDVLEQSSICNMEIENKFENLHIAIVYRPDEIEENDFLRTEGLRLSSLLHSDFIDLSKFYCESESLENTYVNEILKRLTASLQTEEIKPYEKYKAFHPDLKIVLSIFCGDLSSPESITNSLMDESSLVFAQEQSLVVDTFLGETKKQVEIIISSYHGVSQYFKEMVQGFIFFYSTKRKSSLANLSSIIMNAPKVPIQIVAITECGGANAFFDSDLSQVLITEGNSIADHFKANFMTFSARETLKFALYMPFLKKVWDERSKIETSHFGKTNINLLQYSLLDIRRAPQEQENYLLQNTLNIDESDCNNYAVLPKHLINTISAETDMSKDDIDVDTRKGFQNYPPPATPPEPAPPDHSQVALHIFREDLVSTSHSSLDEINSDLGDCKSTVNIHDMGWVDDSHILKSGKDKYHFDKYNQKATTWNNFSKHAFTTGRRHNDSCVVNKIRPKGPSQTLKQPGKLNLKNFQIVSEAVARLNMNHEFKNTEVSESNSSSSESKATVEFQTCKKTQSCKKIKKKRVAIPVQPPKIPLTAICTTSTVKQCETKRKSIENIKTKSMTTEFSNDEISLTGNHNLKNNKAKMTVNEETDKFILLKTKLKNWRDEEKCETPKLREDNGKTHKTSKNEKETDKKIKRKTKQNVKVLSNIENLESTSSLLSKFIQIEKNNIPIFLLKCINFIEKEGLDSEGIYRVPGNRIHVDLLLQRFQEDPHTIIENLDVPINAVATALKEFFSKILPPLFDKGNLTELENIAEPHLSKDAKSNRDSRLIALKNMLTKLPDFNFGVLKCIFQHFVRVSENSKLNSMDSKNLAICWWPTLIQIEFLNMGHFEQLRPHLEDIVQEMIDQFSYLFCEDDSFMVV